ncbi:S8 family peptidase [Phyllobacterium zundukense]|uniref:S8 family peptidase n=1 Tax=Phyllobacterium zundukense TaxID=1867719 RepID=A0ACD4CW57_9HYPH|nr:S8 family peptidase [Phyllobacterium zundukense]UXN57794.1 S8 family peptidase [Phyllobacterium zundukense]
MSRERCEVGAIETIELTPSNLKRGFAADAAVAAMSDPRAASGYIVELFETEPLISASDHDALGFHRSVSTLQAIFYEGGAGLLATLLPSPGGVPAIEVMLTKSGEQPRIEDRRVVQVGTSDIVAPVQLDRDVQRHDTLLRRLAEHPLVRQIRFPILIETTETQAAANTPMPFPSVQRVANGRYPKVGVIDTGVAGPLTTWVLNRHDFVDETDCDPGHGTMVAGVLIGARVANNPQLGREEDGCDIVDIPLMPRVPFLSVYGQRGFEAFLEELEAAIEEARDQHGVRVFNMSLNVVAPVDPDTYSIYAARLDDIQDRLGVVIVNSAGNLAGNEWRAPWAAKPTQVLAKLAARTNVDTIYMPCESVRTIAVGALNPPGSTHIETAPTTYTRRGPGLKVGVKPDLAHFGGTGDLANAQATHLVSCDAVGNAVHTRGTSFAAPLVAKTMAALDIATGERLEPRTLRAFLIHNASVPQPLTSPRLRDVARQFVGFGQPSSAAEMLETGEHAITMVFESRLTAGERKPAILRFDFQWPAPLVDAATRSCRGRVRITLVYDAPIDQAFGTEFLRVNLSAHLRQRQPIDRKDGMPSFRDEISQVFLPRTGKLTIPERALIDHGLKWWPTKRYGADFGAGVGSSAEWRLEVESVVRAEATFPAEGIPFSVILTIEDDEGAAPIFQSFRQALVARRVDMQDIRTAVRLRAQSRR